nr:MAG TPA: hypothetical protein [Caudoviricetes sp.]
MSSLKMQLTKRNWLLEGNYVLRNEFFISKLLYNLGGKVIYYFCRSRR